MLNVGVIGCGNIGRLHANAYANAENVKLCALIDTNLENAKKLAEQFGGEAYASINDVPVKLDLVSVVVPPSAHYGVVSDLLNRGISVFVEKPMTMDVEQAKALLKQSQETGLSIGVGFKMRYEAVFQKAKELVGKLGEIYSVAETSNQPMAKVPEKPWVMDTGVMYELSIHDYDLIHWIMDSVPVAVSATLDSSWGWKRENFAYLTVEYANGAKGQLMNTYSPGSKHGFDRVITFFGENGYMRVERPNQIVLHANGEHEVITVEPFADADVFRKEIEAFIDSVLKKVPYYPGVAEGAINTILIEAANQADKAGKKVVLADL